MNESVLFVSTCPKCKVSRPQRGFSRVALVRLLKSAQPIEAYCMKCDEFWCLTERERADLARAVED